MKIRPAILLIKDEKILTMQYRYGNEDVFNLPGGNVELGEALTEVLERELAEELMLKVAVEELVIIGDVFFEEKKQQTLHCIFKGRILEGEPILNPKETSSLAIKWLKISELHKVNMYPNVGLEIQKLLAGELTDKYIGRIFQKWF